MRRVLVSIAATAALLFAVAGSAMAKPPVGGCPSSEWFLDESPSDVSGSPSVDQNGDGLSCFMEAPEGGGIFTIVDNVSHSR